MTTETVQTPEETLVRHIAATLNEQIVRLIRKIVKAIGTDRAEEFLQKTLEIEAAGGMTTTDSSRRRSPGGMFFYMVRTGLPQEERKQIWSNTRKKKQAEASPDSAGTEE